MQSHEIILEDNVNALFVEKVGYSKFLSEVLCSVKNTFSEKRKDTGHYKYINNNNKHHVTKY